MKLIFLFILLLFSLFSYNVLSFAQNQKEKKNVKQDFDLVKNMQNFLQLNISYNESKEAYDFLQKLKISYQNYSKEITNMSKNFF